MGMEFYNFIVAMVKPTYPSNLMIIVAEIDVLMQQFNHTKKDIAE
jgi:hypothetical protein